MRDPIRARLDDFDLPPDGMRLALRAVLDLLDEGDRAAEFMETTHGLVVTMRSRRIRAAIAEKLGGA